MIIFELRDYLMKMNVEHLEVFSIVLMIMLDVNSYMLTKYEKIFS